jgi:hypothetical protein
MPSGRLTQAAGRTLPGITPFPAPQFLIVTLQLETAVTPTKQTTAPFLIVTNETFFAMQNSLLTNSNHRGEHDINASRGARPALTKEGPLDRAIDRTTASPHHSPDLPVALSTTQSLVRVCPPAIQMFRNRTKTSIRPGCISTRSSIHAADRVHNTRCRATYVFPATFRPPTPKPREFCSPHLRNRIARNSLKTLRTPSFCSPHFCGFETLRNLRSALTRDPLPWPRACTRSSRQTAYRLASL